MIRILALWWCVLSVPCSLLVGMALGRMDLTDDERSEA